MTDVASDVAKSVATASEAVRSKRKRWGRNAIIGRMPRGCTRVQELVSHLRRRLEKEVLASKGTIDVVTDMALQSVLRHEAVSLLCLKTIRTEWEKMTLEQRLAYLRAMSAESDLRDKALRALNLDGGPDPIDALYRRATLSDLGVTESEVPNEQA